MALQSSGQISITDIKTELGSSSGSLTTLSTAAGKTAPHAMSEFYGYSNAKYYWELSNDIKWDAATDKPLQSTSEDFSMSLWIRPQWTATDLNLIIFDLTPSGTTSTANRFFLQYDYGLNRFIARYRSSSTNFDRQLALHSNNTVTGTGSGSTENWSVGNRGNTNTDGFVHLALTYDASQSTAAAAFKIYWNGSEMTSTAASNNGSRSNMTLDELTFCGNDHNTGGSRVADYMYMHMWDTLLGSEDIINMYNSGDPISASNASITTDLIFGDTSSSVPSANTADDSGNYDFNTANGQSLGQV
jgi:hypothetical protein